MSDAAGDACFCSLDCLRYIHAYLPQMLRRGAAIHGPAAPCKDGIDQRFVLLHAVLADDLEFFLYRHG